MNVIFLDHDGVICLTNEFGSRYKKRKKMKLPNVFSFGSKKTIYDFDNFNKKAINVLNEIIQVTNAKIVTTSDWRINASIELLTEIYTSQGVILNHPIDKTIVFDTNSEDLEAVRTFEIKKYLEDHPEIINYVVIDDLKLFDFNENFIYCPKENEGIKQSGLKEKIIKIFN